MVKSVKHFDCSGVRRAEEDGARVDDGAASGEGGVGSAAVLESLFDLINLTTRITTTIRMVAPMSPAAT